MNTRPSLDSTIVGRPGAQDNHPEDCHHPEHKRPRKRSILLNMVLPPEVQPADSSAAPPLPKLIPPVLEPSFTPRAGKSQETSTSVRGWTSGSGDGSKSKEANTHLTKRGGKNHKDKSANMEHSKSEVVSKTTFIRSWISKISRTETHSKDHQLQLSGTNIVEDRSMVVTSNTVPGAMGAAGQHQGMTTATTTSTTVVQEVHKTRSVALINVNVSIQDVFGLGKVMEVAMALFDAHGSFLGRQPFWLQCTVMAWEGLLLMLIVWGLLRIVGLAEVIVWGADDLVRGTLSTVQLVGRALISLVR